MKIKKFSLFLNSIACIIFSVISVFSIRITESYKLEKFSSTIYKQTQKNDSYECKILNVKKNKARYDNDTDVIYKDAFNQFYYNKIVADTRLIIDDVVRVESTETNIKLFTQDTFSISNDFLPEGGHYVDYGMFSSYYADDILGRRKYLFERFGCDSFVYISDTFANKLLEKYGISSYEELIRNEQYAVLEVKINDTGRFKFSINNILYSDKRHAKRASELYGDFALVYETQKLKKVLNTSIEFDLKSNPYCVKQTITQIKSLGYNLNNSQFNFGKFNKETMSFEIDRQTNSKFIDSQKFNNSSGITFFCIVFLFNFIAQIILSVFLKNKKRRILSLLVFLTIFSIYCLVLQILETNLFVFVMPLLTFVEILILFRKEAKYVFEFVFCKIFHAKIESKDKIIFNLEI